MKALTVTLILGVVGLHGCHGGGASPEVPARLVDTTPESRAELATVVSRALGAEDLMLSGDALTADSRLIIERQAHRDLEHGRIMGRDVERPEQFRLVKQGERCILLHVGSDQRWELTRAHCIPE